MFGKLKDKLKKTLNIFSKKTEEEAEEKQVEQVVEEPKEEKVEEKVEKKEEPKKEEKEESVEEEKAEEEPAEELVEEKSVEPEVKEEEVVEEDSVEEKEEKTEEVKEELESPVDEPIGEEKIVEEKEEVVEDNKIEEQPVEKEDVKEEVVEEPGKEEEEEDKPEEKVEEPVEKVKEESETLVEESKPEEIAEEVEEKQVEEVVEPKEENVEEKPKKKSFFGRLKETITTKTISADKFDSLFWDLELVLLENNVSVEVIEKIKTDLKEELVDKPLPRDVPKKIEETLRNTLTEILTFDPINLLARIKKKESKPYVVAFFGINGCGKTTTIAKLAHKLQQSGLKTVLAASDTFRAAAIQQLEEHSKKLGTKIIKHDYGSDAAAVAFDAIKYAQKNKLDAVLIDTAGRLHSNINLMDELKKIVKVTNPDLKVFIGESITGNDCIEQAKQFNEVVKVDAAILTKADVDEKGGAPLSIAYTINRPILYLGKGQEYSDLEEFNVDKMMKRLGF